MSAGLVFISDVNSLGLDIAKGMYLTTAFYWDYDDQTRAWARRFQNHPDNKKKAMPTMVQAGQYSSVMHYLKAVQAIHSDDTAKVMAQMKKTPVNDFFAKNATIRDDGRLVDRALADEIRIDEIVDALLDS